MTAVTASGVVALRLRSLRSRRFKTIFAKAWSPLGCFMPCLDLELHALPWSLPQIGLHSRLPIVWSVQYHVIKSVYIFA